MTEILLFSIAFSLLLTVLYGFVRKQNSIESQLRSVRRIETVAGVRIANTSSIPATMNAILSALSSAYNAPKGKLEFHARLFGDFSCTTNDEKSFAAESMDVVEGGSAGDDKRNKDSRSERRDGQISFVVDGEDFSCRVELYSNDSLSHSEHWNVQELIKDKLSRCLLDKVTKTIKAGFEGADIPCAIINRTGKVLYKNEAFARNFQGTDTLGLSGSIPDLMNSKCDTITISVKDHAGQNEGKSEQVNIQRIGDELFIAFSTNGMSRVLPNTNEESEKLLFNAMDGLNLGVVVLEKDDLKQGKDFRVASINKAFYRIFGLVGSNAQLEEVDEILSSAVRPDERKNFSERYSTNDFFYMRRDGIKIRAKLTLIRVDDHSLVVVFEPVENAQLLISSYRRLAVGAERLFKNSDVRSFLEELRAATRSDGLTLAEKSRDSSSFELTEKAGFVINIPQLIFSELNPPGASSTTRDLINYQGYLVIPMRQHEKVTGALIALKPSEDQIELVVAGARILEAYDLIKRETAEIRLQIAKVASEAKRSDGANRSKSQFLANMSHEIRTPLNSIIGFGNIIHDEMSELSGELLHEFSGNIVTAGNHLLSLINDILDLTKVETGKMELDPQKFSIREVVGSVNRVLKPLLNIKQVQFVINIDDRVEEFIADQVKFKQILYNLLNNAITYSHENGAVKLEIVKSANGIEMKVIDNGLGIKREDLDRLFKPFVQISGENGGTGLGLVLTQKLVELHGGAIWIDSTFGIGTSVVVYLPEFKFSETIRSEESLQVNTVMPQKLS